MEMSAQFPRPLLLRVWTPQELDRAGYGVQQYDLRGSFAFQSPGFGWVAVPEGFVTDFASIPRIAWRYISPEDPCVLMPSVIHDWLYSQQGKIEAGQLTRQQVDFLFAHEAMPACGARWDQCAAVYAAVRLFGGSHWQSSK